MTGVYEEQHQNHQKRRREDGNGAANKKRRFEEEEEGGKQHGNLQDLPLDIIKLIFSRLSINDLFQCADLSGAWSDVILHDQKFAAMQHARAMENEEKSLGLIVFTQTICGSSKTLYFSERGGDGHQKTMAIEAQFKEKLDVGGSCNGLLYLCDSFSYDPMYVCNPITGEYMKLPGKTPHDFVISGFGFDAEKSEYKVVRILYRFQDDGDEYDDEWYPGGEVEIHTLGTDCWRRIGGVSHQISINNQYSDVIVNGALHWMLDTPLDSELILALDMGEEKFRTVPLPDFGLDADPGRMHLMAWKGRLSVIEHNTENTCIWVMNNYNDGSSWTMNLSVRWPTWLRRCPGQYQPFDDESMKDAQFPVALKDVEAKHHTVTAIAHMGSLLSLHRFSPDVKKMTAYF